MEKVNGNFPKTEKIEIRLRQDLADRLPKAKSEKNAFINRAVEHELDGPEWLKKAHRSKSPAKAAVARENGKKGGRPKKSLKDDFELDVIKDGKPRKLRLVNDGGKQYHLYTVYPDGQQVRTRYQPKEDEDCPDIKFLAVKNGFEVANG